MFKNKRDLVFVVCLVLIHLLFFGFAVFQNNYYPISGFKNLHIDPYQYLTEAKNIIEHGIFYCDDLSNPINFDYYTLRPPVYPLFLSLFYLFKAPLFVIIFFQNIISIISIYLVRKTLFLFNYKTKYDVIFIILLALTPSQFIYANTIFSEVIFQFFIVLMFRNALLFIYFKEKKYLIWYSFALILAAFTKPVMYLFVIPSLIYMVYLSYKIKKWYPAILSILPVLAIFLMLTWNYKRTNKYQYSSIQTINLLNYNTRLFLMSKKGYAYADKFIDSIHNNANKIQDYAKRTTYLNKASKNFLSKNLISYGFYHLQGSVYAILDPGRYDISNFFLLNTKNVNQKGILYHLNNGGIISVLKFLVSTYSIPLLLILGLILFLNVFKLLSLVLFILNKRINLNFKIIVLGLLLYIILLAGPVGASRYFMPLVPLIIGVILIDNVLIKKLFNKINMFKNRSSNEK
ncbi:hypothetical protein [Lutibacter sp.]|uniref:hypothetical protein n=1 Tax=Lutibacter sp. TaxID=1925666 RepID=UPI0025C205F9|nr:hypothetical protein [Lutibacter sp.]MCF6182816.1 glycosyltransferase family 39 protein [Lutibacter sp.]